MKKNVLFCIVIGLTIFTIMGCTNQNSPDDVTPAPPAGTDEQNKSSDDQFISFDGRVAMITEDVVLKKLYTITVDTENKPVYEELNDAQFSLNKGDMVIVIEEKDTECRIMQAFGDIPVLRGTVDKSKLTYDESLFEINANQAVVDNAMGYDGIEGNEKGVQNGTITSSLTVKRNKKLDNLYG